MLLVPIVVIMAFVVATMIAWTTASDVGADASSAFFSLLPAVTPVAELPTTDPPPFGHGMLQYFQLDPNYTNLNHGSYGSPPKLVTAAALAWEQHVELNPDKWFRYEYFSAMDKLRERIAKYIGARKEDIVFVPNASHGMNAILRSLKLEVRTPAHTTTTYFSPTTTTK